MKRINHWTDQEDKLLLQIYDSTDCFQKWKFIAKKLQERGVSKNETQCRERFVNKLNPKLRQDKIETSELKLLFQYYDQYGPLWSVFESLIPGRNQNLLKNKFYSTLRSLVRILITAAEKNNSCKTNISSASLSSKLLVEIYEGKKNFRKFKGVLSVILKKLNFQLDIENFDFLQEQMVSDIVLKIKQQIPTSKKIKNCQFEKLSDQMDKIKSSKSFNDLEKINTSPTTIIESCQKINQKDVITQASMSSDIVSGQTGISFYYLESIPFSYFIPVWTTP